MGKASRRRCRQRRQDIIDDDEVFQHLEDCRRHDVPFLQIFMVMMLSMLIAFIPWLSEYGAKEKEVKRDRKPFDQQVEAKLSDYFF